MPAAGVPLLHRIRNILRRCTVIVGQWDADRALHLTPKTDQSVPSTPTQTV
jgi:hypothetical protein